MHLPCPICPPLHACRTPAAASSRLWGAVPDVRANFAAPNEISLNAHQAGSEYAWGRPAGGGAPQGEGSRVRTRGAVE